MLVQEGKWERKILAKASISEHVSGLNKVINATGDSQSTVI